MSDGMRDSGGWGKDGYWGAPLTPVEDGGGTKYLLGPNTPTVLRVECAWCNSHLSGPRDSKQAVSHGACEECVLREVESCDVRLDAVEWAEYGENPWRDLGGEGGGA